MKIVVTGGSGAIGGRLCSRLLEVGHDVVSLGRNVSKVFGVQNITVKDYEPQTIISALENIPFDGLIHLAATATRSEKINSLEAAEVNGILPAKVVNAAYILGAKAVVIAGTNAEYADAGAAVTLTEEMLMDYSSLYGATKAAGGILALNQGVQNNIPVAVARIFNVYGPGDHSLKLLPSLIDGLSKGLEVKLSSGAQKRDFIYIDDACDGIISIIIALISGQAKTGYFNVCTGTATSIADFARKVAKIMGVDNALLKFGVVADRENEIKYSVGSIKKIQNNCLWKAEYNLEEGIKASLNELVKS